MTCRQRSVVIAVSAAGLLLLIAAPQAGAQQNRNRQRANVVRDEDLPYPPALPDGQTVFGVSEPGQKAACWLGPQEWQVSGPAGRDLGRALWRAFLDAGGPWPTEFRLRADPRRGLTADRPEGYVRQGPRCQQVWELVEPRERPGWA